VPSVSLESSHKGRNHECDVEKCELSLCSYKVTQIKESTSLTLILLTWRIWWACNYASRWQVGFNSAFKGL